VSDRPPPPPGQSADDIAVLLEHTQYRGIKNIGRGAMGAVYEIEHRLLRRRFALKVLHARLAIDRQYVDRMRVEAQSMARLSHPNLVEVVDFWTAADARPCIVMELLRGHTLAQELIERRKPPVSESVKIARQVLAALGAAHAEGVVHRDIKPENIFRTTTGAIKVLDFGVARVLPIEPRSPLAPLAIPTDTGTVVGSPRFLSPEGAAGRKVDHRADICSVGLVLYVMLAGRGPFDNLTQTVALAPSSFRHEVTPELDAVVMKAIEERPERRFQSAAEFSSALDQLGC